MIRLHLIQEFKHVALSQVTSSGVREGSARGERSPHADRCSWRIAEVADDGACVKVDADKGCLHLAEEDARLREEDRR